MADTKMSALPARTLLASSDEFLNLAGGVNYRSPLSSLAAIIGGVDDTAYDATSWDGVTGVAPSKNAIRDKIVAMDAAIAAAGAVSDTAFGVSWDGVVDEAASKNALYDLLSVMQADIDALEALIMPSPPITLLTNRTTDGSPGGVSWAGGPGLVTAYGTWGGASVQLAYSPDSGTTYIDTDGALFTANGSMLVTYPAGLVRATIAGATSTSLSSKLESTR